MATAIRVRTVSGDHYLFCHPLNLTEEEATTYVREQLQDESGFIDEQEMVHSERGL